MAADSEVRRITWAEAARRKRAKDYELMCAVCQLLAAIARK
jgi:hypothetical protein